MALPAKRPIANALFGALLARAAPDPTGNPLACWVHVASVVDENACGAVLLPVTPSARSRFLLQPRPTLAVTVTRADTGDLPVCFCRILSAPPLILALMAISAPFRSFWLYAEPAELGHTSLSTPD